MHTDDGIQPEFSAVDTRLGMSKLALILYSSVPVRGFAILILIVITSC